MAVHGGAGTIERSRDDRRKRRGASGRDSSTRCEAGYDILKRAAAAWTRSKRTIRTLEDNPLFNAGKGAVFTHEGTNELDASIMDGKTLQAGAVAGVQHIKNPISLARLVMEKSPHVMLAGAGAEAFAKAQGIELRRSEILLHRRALAGFAEGEENERLVRRKGQARHRRRGRARPGG